MHNDPTPGTKSNCLEHEKVRRNMINLPWWLRTCVQIPRSLAMLFMFLRLSFQSVK